MLVLALDTSTPVMTAGVVLLEDEKPGRLLAEQSLVDPFAHAEHLMPLLQQALSDAGRRLVDADTVVVGLGPGPFTGLRVGVASAAALGDALGIPVYGVGSHDAFAATVFAPRSGGGDLLVVTDARRREVYVSAYRDGLRVAGPAPVAPAALPQWITDQQLTPGAVTGPGTTLISAVLAWPVRNPAVATSLGLVTAATSDIRGRVIAGPLTPLYLRRPDATEPSGTRKSVLGR